MLRLKVLLPSIFLVVVLVDQTRTATNAPTTNAPTTIVPTTSTGHCDQHILQAKAGSVMVLTDLAPCYCTDECTLRRLDQLTRQPADLADFAAKSYQLFECVQHCFKVANEPPSQITNTKTKTTGHEIEWTKVGQIKLRAQIKEADFVTSQLTDPKKSQYRPLLTKLEQVRLEDNKRPDNFLVSPTGSSTHSSSTSGRVPPPYVFVRGHKMADTCFMYSVLPRQNQGLVFVLGQTYSCRLFMRCFVTLVRQMVVGNADTAITVNDFHWEYYLCARAAYTESTQVVDSLVIVPTPAPTPSKN